MYGGPSQLRGALLALRADLDEVVPCLAIVPGVVTGDPPEPRDALAIDELGTGQALCPLGIAPRREPRDGIRSDSLHELFMCHCVVPPWNCYHLNHGSVKRKGRLKPFGIISFRNCPNPEQNP